MCLFASSRVWQGSVVTIIFYFSTKGISSSSKEIQLLFQPKEFFYKEKLEKYEQILSLIYMI